ncbi:probable LRR receptor-like serine/threonine-protein kinase At5g48740 [Cryptomeria japonica]|uniref:probable LRR receptor-like serine/threonine-protein kinase At5g48740 n=1 Tax=Cryptomeria japonica TaxID=3369 RepID=UPI0025AD26F9|nr:probable LRR receptor-like serine/threonine-protein kinase At5g48740 [Cryptomeria japonica]
MEFDVSMRPFACGTVTDQCLFTRIPCSKEYLSQDLCSISTFCIATSLIKLGKVVMTMSSIGGIVHVQEPADLTFRSSDLARGGKNNGLEIGSIIGGILAVQLVLVFLNGIWKPNANTDLPVKVLNHVRTRSFSIEELRTATQNFNQEIGKGDFGTVFYGKLLDEKEIAVKVLSSSSKQGLLEFLYEKDLLSRLNHKNLVWLLGYCNSSKELMLVYEYVGGGSLRDYLHGLDYGLMGRHINLFNLKVWNICIRGPDRKSFTEMYFSTNKLTERNDVYSFGVVLLEIICGRKPIEDAACEEEVNLVRWRNMVQLIVAAASVTLADDINIQLNHS